MKTIQMTRRPLAGLAAFAVVVITAGHASADIINIFSDSGNSTEGLGEFTGTIEYNFNSGNEGTLNVSLTNTSDPDNGGFITGFVFNIDSTDPDAAATLTAGTHPFLDASGQNAPPFGGPFTGGAALGGNWGGNGDPSDGIAVGDTGMFEFGVIASDAMFLSASSFINGPFEFNFIVRFQGFLDGGSDKVPGVPGPGALTLLGLSLLAGTRRRRRSN